MFLRDHAKFAAWWVSVLLIATGIFWAGYFGLIEKVWEADETMITSLIAILFVGCNVFLGAVSFDADRSPFLSNTKKRLESVWFMSEQVMALGMLGTVIGLIMMLATGFVGVGGDMQALLSKMWAAMGLALYTNAVGLICSIVLKIQVYVIGYGLDET